MWCPVALVVVVGGLLLRLLLSNLEVKVSGTMDGGGTMTFNASALGQLAQLDGRLQQLEALLGEDSNQLLASLGEKRSILQGLLEEHVESTRTADFAVATTIIEHVLSPKVWGQIKLRVDELFPTDQELVLRQAEVRAAIAADKRLQFERENFDRIQEAELRKLRLEMELQRETWLASVAAVRDSSCCVLAFGAATYHFILRSRPPPLVDETSAPSSAGLLLILCVRCMHRLRRMAGKPEPQECLLPDTLAQGYPKVVLEEDTAAAARDLLHGLRAALHTGGALPSACFYGPPGTGKTLTARRIAETSGMDYALMSGGSVISLQAQAVPELRKVFRWVRRSPKGLLLFIDEAEAFLQRREACADPFVRAAISFFLSQTGEASPHFCIVLATNCWDQLDDAVKSRVSAVRFRSPTSVQLKELCRSRCHDLAELLAANWSWEALARAGFSGRDVQQLHEERQRQQLLWRLRHGQASDPPDGSSNRDNRGPESRWLHRFVLQKVLSRLPAGATDTEAEALLR